MRLQLVRHRQPLHHLEGACCKAELASRAVLLDLYGPDLLVFEHDVSASRRTPRGAVWRACVPIPCQTLSKVDKAPPACSKVTTATSSTPRWPAWFSVLATDRHDGPEHPAEHVHVVDRMLEERPAPCNFDVRRASPTRTSPRPGSTGRREAPPPSGTREQKGQGRL